MNLVLLILLALPAAATARGITPADYFDFRFIEDPRIAPDGRS